MHSDKRRAGAQWRSRAVQADQPRDFEDLEEEDETLVSSSDEGRVPTPKLRVGKYL